MKRRRFRPTAPNPTADFTPREIAKLRAMRETRFWQSLERGLEFYREALFAETPDSNRAEWMNRGQLQLLTQLLNHGPAFVLHSERLNRRPDRRTHDDERPPPDPDEREFNQHRSRRRTNGHDPDGISGPGPARYRE